MKQARISTRCMSTWSANKRNIVIVSYASNHVVRFHSVYPRTRRSRQAANSSRRRRILESQMDRSQIVHTDPEILGGTPVFVGTRVPVQTLLTYLEKGETLEEFLDNFPTVSREQAVAFLEEAGRALLAQIA